MFNLIKRVPSWQTINQWEKSLDLLSFELWSVELPRSRATWVWSSLVERTSSWCIWGCTGGGSSPVWSPPPSRENPSRQGRLCLHSRTMIISSRENIFTILARMCRYCSPSLPPSLTRPSFLPPSFISFFYILSYCIAYNNMLCKRNLLFASIHYNNFIWLKNKGTFFVFIS